MREKLRTQEITKQQASALIQIAFALGWKPAAKIPGWETAAGAIENHDHDSFPCFALSVNRTFTFSGFLGKASYADAVVALAEPVKFVQLNDDYAATQEGDEVVVGCQRFPLSKITELYETFIRS